MSRRRWIAALAGLLLLTGCTTIPSSSSPQVIRTLNRGSSGSPQATITPEPGDDPRAVVQKFIAAGVLAGASHSSSRQFLTTSATRKWQDTSTVILDDPRADASTAEGTDRAIVPVKGRRVGQLDSHGVYTPILKNLGKGDEESFTFRLVKTAGQWRIDQLPTGVLVSEQAFTSSFIPVNTLYFLNAAADTSQLALVPDLRYTSLTDQAQASWLLTQLLAGPRPELAQSVASEIPDQVGKPTVQLGDPITVELPGASQLDGTGRNALAAQLAFTFQTFEYGGAQLMITDGGRPVRIPDAVGTNFSTNDFNVLSPSSPSSASAYYVHDGAVIDASDDTPLDGLLGQPNQLDSVALRDDSTGAVQQAAGIRQGALLVGTSKRLTRVPLPVGELSRPEWRPRADEVWVGLGTKGAIYRVTTTGLSARAVSVTSPVGGSLTGQVLALRFSPDGARIAAVVRAPDGTSAVWVGSVVSSGTDVQIDSLEPVTPAQLVVSDVAWSDETDLSLIGASTASAGPAQVWKLESDGSQLTPVTTGNLPLASPSAIAERGDGQPPTLISVSGVIWALTSPQTGWSSYPATKNANQGGTNPIFAE